MANSCKRTTTNINVCLLQDPTAFSQVKGLFRLWLFTGIDLSAIPQKSPDQAFYTRGSIEWRWRFDHYCVHSIIKQSLAKYRSIQIRFRIAKRPINSFLPAGDNILLRLWAYMYFFNQKRLIRNTTFRSPKIKKLRLRD